jgi:transposase InsO family protein
MPKKPLDTAIDRYTAVAAVLAKVAAGTPLSRAFRLVAKTPVRCLDGRTMRLSVRTLQRWVAAYQAQGIDALVPASRLSAEASAALSEDFLRHLVDTKAKDPDASIPEVIRQARLFGIIAADERVSRVSVWRAARRLNLPIFSRKAVESADMRRYEYAHRMQMVLGDGKHFRAGAKARRRVVITLIDDASRMALGAVVGKSESSALFLACLWKVLLRWGCPEHIFLDNGSGFIAKDVAVVCARLDIKLVFGTAGHAPGHGKIERYHRTLIKDLLRGFRGNPAIDPDCAALELRIEHYLAHDYNRSGHESLADNTTPESRFLTDALALRPLADPERVRQLFIITTRRKVSRDNIIMVRRVPYEMPRGHAGTRVEVYRHLLDRSVSVIHEGRLVQLFRVDPVLNAKTRRGRQARGEDVPAKVPPKTAATLRFERDHQPLVGPAGDCHEEP